MVRIIELKKEPILIAGCGRSGTSLLLSILSAHPNILGIPVETNIYGYPRKFNSVLLNRVNNYRKLLPYLIQNDKLLTAERWCEKTPRNIRFISDIITEFNSNVKIIHIIRDGRSVVTSIHPLSNEYHVPISRWINDVNAGLKYREHKCIYEIRYEDIINDYNAAIRKLLAFLNEDIHPNIFHFEKFSNVKTHDAYLGKRLRSINNASLMKWKDRHHQDIIKQFYKNCEAIELMCKLGYEI